MKKKAMNLLDFVGESLLVAAFGSVAILIAIPLFIYFALYPVLTEEPMIARWIIGIFSVLAIVSTAIGIVRIIMYLYEEYKQNSN